jgi:beta-xylosidase
MDRTINEINEMKVCQALKIACMRNKIMLFFFAIMACWLHAELLQAQQTSFRPGEPWSDTNNEPINAHGAGVLYYQGTYYLFGEIKKGKTWLVEGQGWECYRVPAGGVACYSSKDLLNWKYESVALAATTGNPLSDLDTGKVVERPKVIYNVNTKKFVMWMHIDSKEYSSARSGVATSDTPVGPYQYLRSVKPNGNDARDMTLFQDDDGKAYHIYSSEGNKTMHICLLSDDYLEHTKNEKRILIDQSREAPAMFKQRGKYYLITSGCTGWAPNVAQMATSAQPMGEWKQVGNPCTGKNADNTFSSQSTFVLPVAGKKNAFIFMADRWNKSNLEESRYVWLPLIIKKGKPQISWVDSWDTRVF